MQIWNLVKTLATDVLRCLHFLTRLPLPALSYKPFAALTLALPLAALALALLLGLAFQIFIALFGPQSPIASLLFIAVYIWITGALHEDAWADTFDGLGGGTNRGHKLEIMKDSAIGAFGVVALAILLLLRWSGWWHLSNPSVPWAEIIAILLLSRWSFMPSMAFQPQARTLGYGASAGRADLGLVALTGLGVIITASILTSPLIVLALLPTFALGFYAQQKLGGVTGDIYGAQVMATEASALLILVTQIACTSCVYN